MGRHTRLGDGPGGLTEDEAALVMRELVVAWRKGVADGVIIGWLVALLVVVLVFA